MSQTEIKQTQRIALEACRRRFKNMIRFYTNRVKTVPGVRDGLSIEGDVVGRERPSEGADEYEVATFHRRVGTDDVFVQFLNHRGDPTLKVKARQEEGILVYWLVHPKTNLVVSGKMTTPVAHGEK